MSSSRHCVQNSFQLSASESGIQAPSQLNDHHIATEIQETPVDIKSPVPLCKLVQDKFKELEVFEEPLLSPSLQQEICKINKIFLEKSVLISVFGLHNSGKSTLINTLLGVKVVPESWQNETGVTVKIHPIYSQQDTTPVLEVKSGGKVERSIREASNIHEAIKTLSNDARSNKFVPDSVVVSVSAPELFVGVEEGWRVCLLDNPGFGEDNMGVQQIAMAAVGPSAAYMFLTTIDSIGGTTNAKFFRDLKMRDKDSFSDGRLIVVVPKMDTANQSMDDTNLEPEKLIKSVCEKISKAADIPDVSADIVIPVSCFWYKKSRQLAEASKSEEEDLKEDAIGYLSKCPLFELEATGQGVSRRQSLRELPSPDIVKYLEDASRLPLLKSRLKVMMNDTCVSTWRKKVLAGYQFCLVKVVSELEEHAEIISRMIKDVDDELDKVQPMLADTLDKEKQFSAYHLDRSTQLREELTGQFKEDSTSGSLRQNVSIEVTTMLEEFEKKCLSRVESESDTFGPKEYKNDLQSFLEHATTRINSFLNGAIIFKALPQALVKWNEKVEDAYRELCVTSTTLIDHTVYKDGGKAPERCPNILLDDQSRVKKPELQSNLSDLKNEISIPPVTLTVWEKIAQYFKSWLTTLRAPPQYKSLAIKENVSMLSETIEKKCFQYIDDQVKPKAVEHHHSKYEEKVKKCLSKFKQQYAAAISKAKDYVKKLKENKEKGQKQLDFISCKITECKELDDKLKAKLEGFLGSRLEL